MIDGGNIHSKKMQLIFFKNKLFWRYLKRNLKIPRKRKHANFKGFKCQNWAPRKITK